MLTAAIKYLLHINKPLKGRSGGSGGGSGGGQSTTLGSINWANPNLGGSKSALETVEVNKVWGDFQASGLTDISRTRVDTQKRLIQEAQRTGGEFRAPDIAFVSAAVARRTGLPRGYSITDGRHRITALRELGFTKIKALVDRG